MKSFAVLALWLCVGQAAAQSAQSCFEDVSACLPDFRSRFLSIDHFWYGTPYTTLCPGLPYCVNVGPHLQSVMSRTLWTNDTSAQQAAVSDIQILNVTFEQPARSYYACDAWIQVAPTPPVQVNPLGPTLLSQLNTRTKPRVTWTPRTPQSLYTVAMVDTSYMYLHALYINCANGTMDTGEAVVQWMGTAVIYLVNSPYVYLVYQQLESIPSQAALQAVENTRTDGTGVAVISIFQINVFVQRMSTYLNPAIQFSVIMEMYPDPYGSYRHTELRYVIDQCPFFYSQLSTFHSAVRGMQIPNPRWSPPAFSLSQVSTDAQLTSLTIKLDITYHTDDYTDTACCQAFSVTRGSYAVSPLDSRPVAAAMTRHAPRVFLKPIFIAAANSGRDLIAARTYTLLMADVTPTLTSNATGPNLTIHWLVTNILASQFETGTEVARYFPPSPADEETPRTYMFLLFDQPSVVNVSTLQPFCPRGFERCELRVTDLIQTWGLGDIVSVSWFQSKFDGFALKQHYTAMKMPEQQVCKGREGYAVPCEVADSQRCSAIGQFGLSSRLLIGLLAALVLLLTNSVKA